MRSPNRTKGNATMNNDYYKPGDVEETRVYTYPDMDKLENALEGFEDEEVNITLCENNMHDGVGQVIMFWAPERLWERHDDFLSKAGIEIPYQKVSSEPWSPIEGEY